MRTYGVICQATCFVVYVGHATSPIDACNRAVREANAWENVGPLQQSSIGVPRDAEEGWLELSVYDVSGLLEPIPNVRMNTEAALAAMTEETHVAHLSLDSMDRRDTKKTSIGRS
jgi:hypothetical protein